MSGLALAWGRRLLEARALLAGRPCRALASPSSARGRTGRAVAHIARVSTDKASKVEPAWLTREMDEVSGKRMFQVVVAATKELGIGSNGGLPWKLPQDMAFFKELTTKTLSGDKLNAVVMGRKTWESIPKKFRPLPGRLNVVLTRSKVPEDSVYPKEVVLCDGLDAALTLLASKAYSGSIGKVFVIGGGEVFREAMDSSFCVAAHVTEIENDFPCDTFLPPMDTAVFRAWRASPPIVENGIRFSFVTYVRLKTHSAKVLKESNCGNTELGNDQDESERLAHELELSLDIRECHEEYQYLHLIRDILQNGNAKGDRTGTGTISKFGCQMRFNLRKSFPLLTTKRVFWRGVAEELLWFISGCTDGRVLKTKGINIWEGNGSRAYLDSIGLEDREEGDLGPVYGFQWRHFGAEYTNMHADYTGKGFDQLADVIHKITTNPEDRRIILSAWNPADLKLMALPPCHMFAQFYVAHGELSCLMYQRSCDMGLGVPFNIASYSLLTCMISQVCGLRPGEFVHVLGDAHVYTNHIEPLEEQLRNIPRPFPVLRLNPEIRDIDSFTIQDLELIGYEPHPKIPMKMAV